MNTKTNKIVYWVATAIFVAFDGLMPLLFFNSKPAIEGIHHLLFPEYFRIELSVGKIIGGVLLILPMIPARFKEWAYVGFGISLISATVGHFAVGDKPGEIMMPVVIFAILLVSYVYYHKIWAPFK